VGPVLAAGVLVRDEQGRYCMLRRGHHPGKGKWAFPGGFVNEDEDPVEAALRETREEAGCECELERLVGAYASDGPRGKRVVILVYLARLTSCVEVECWEVEEVRWFKREELQGLDLAFDSSRAALADLFRTPGAV
jgi:8-oxo-dGTP diphosphatase